MALPCEEARAGSEYVFSGRRGWLLCRGDPRHPASVGGLDADGASLPLLLGQGDQPAGPHYEQAYGTPHRIPGRWDGALLQWTAHMGS